MDKPKDKCAQPARGPLLNSNAKESVMNSPQSVAAPLAKVGGPAPDFEATAFVNGGFENIRLSSFKGKWIVLCFYPGDFTFV
jgi:peroxiredoxin (alkyl hydroperoxide reductase subunit C)